VFSTETCGPADAARRIEELMEAVAARDTFIAVAAHELRNPMMQVMDGAAMLSHMRSKPALRDTPVVEAVLGAIPWNPVPV
jgi:signal transduction histidine kinase